MDILLFVDRIKKQEDRLMCHSRNLTISLEKICTGKVAEQIEINYD